MRLYLLEIDELPAVVGHRFYETLEVFCGIFPTLEAANISAEGNDTVFHWRREGIEKNMTREYVLVHIKSVMESQIGKGIPAS